MCCVLYSVGPEVCSLVHCLLYQSPQSSSRHHLASISSASHHQLNQIGPLIAFIIYLYHSITYKFWGVLLNKYILKLIMLSKFQVFSPYLTYLIFINLLVYFHSHDLIKIHFSPFCLTHLWRVKYSTIAFSQSFSTVCIVYHFLYFFLYMKCEF